jgi:hypothetical protein
MRVVGTHRDPAPSWICTTYTFELYTKYPNDEPMADPESDQNGMNTIASDGVPEFGRLVLITHRARPHLDKLVIYDENIDLASTSALLGPFQLLDETRANQIISLNQWSILCDICMGSSIAPHKMSTNTRWQGTSSVVFQTIMKRIHDQIGEQNHPVEPGVSDKRQKQDECKADGNPPE